MSENESFAQADPQVAASSPGDAPADALRQDILDAAREAFFERGYPATTIEEIATRADVSPGLVDEVLGGTRGALRALMDIAVSDEVSPIRVLEHSAPQRMRREADQRTRLEELASGVVGVVERTGPIFLIMRHAAHSDDEVALAFTDLHDTRRHDMAIVAGWIAEDGPLKADMSVDMATDVLWNLTGPDVHHLLRVHREWSEEQYREWLTATLIASLLP